MGANASCPCCIGGCWGHGPWAMPCGMVAREARAGRAARTWMVLYMMAGDGQGARRWLHARWSRAHRAQDTEAQSSSMHGASRTEHAVEHGGVHGEGAPGPGCRGTAWHAALGGIVQYGTRRYRSIAGSRRSSTVPLYCTSGYTHCPPRALHDEQSLPHVSLTLLPLLHVGQRRYAEAEDCPPKQAPKHYHQQPPTTAICDTHYLTYLSSARAQPTLRKKNSYQLIG